MRFECAKLNSFLDAGGYSEKQRRHFCNDAAHNKCHFKKKCRIYAWLQSVRAGQQIKIETYMRYD